MLLLFKRLSPNSTEMVVTDDAMAPHYSKGDFIAGIRYTGAAIIEHAMYHPCIVETTDGKVLFRQVQSDPNQSGRYRLDCTNPHTTATDSVLCGQELKFAAPVVWQRKLI